MLPLQVSRNYAHAERERGMAREAERDRKIEREKEGTRASTSVCES